ncbi:CPBP family intramembrane metalloprotease [Eggerthella lenta]|uniref:CPBP family intramembrane metalloprotease n=1 Tax=Eggerthella lenta TaxID=84112 RepID=A0A5C5C0Q2_EGGLN|nr:CPBP family intramembrane glutamic endopeptidase [Eggerthella lenta]TNU92163.1 CPBP family intramembrane metalloprotease [Eggerthella lenta]
MSTIRTLARSHPLLATAVGLAIGLAVIWFVPSDGSLANMMFIRLGLTIVMFAIMAVAAGCNIIVPNAKSIGLSFKKSIYPLVVALVMGVFVLLGTAMKNEGMVSDWPLQLALVIMLCLLVGTFEEGLFRGIVFSGLLARFGETRRGLIGAVIVSSLIFGFVHVTPSIMNGQVVTGLDMAQAALKTLQAGILGAFLAALFLKTRNIWGIALVHGLNDLFVMLGDALFSGTTSTTYVNNDAMMASASVVMYGVFFLLYIPIIVSTVRMLKQVEVPCKGPFADRWS